MNAVFEPCRSSPSTPHGWLIRACGCLVVLLVVFPYLCWLITWGAGLGVGDEGFWLIQGREAFRRLPGVAGSLVPLTDVLGGAWSVATTPLGLYGARLGWALLNTTAAALVYLTLSRYFPALRAAVATSVAAPMICNQQFMTLEYTNVPWFFLLLFALSFVASQGASARPAVANGLAVVSGLALAAGILARLPVLPAVLLPLCGWLIGRRPKRAVPLVACYVAAAVSLAAGLVWMWQAGSLADLGKVIQQTRNLSAGAQAAAGGFYSTWRLVSVYIQNSVVGFEQFSVIVLSLVGYVLYRETVDRLFPRISGLVGWLPLIAAVLVAAAAPKAAPGVFNPRFLSGLPTAVLVFCAVELWRSRRAESSSEVIAVRQLLLFGIAIPVLVMIGSNLGFYRMISASWLAIPLAILLIPDAASAAGQRLAALMPEAAGDPARYAAAFLNTVVIATLSYCLAHGIIQGFDGTSPLAQTAALQHPKLKGLRESPQSASAYDGMLSELESRVVPGDVFLAYPHLEMVHWLTDTQSPLTHMFVHSGEATIRAALDEAKPRYIVFHDNNRDPLWSFSESRRAIVDDYVAANGYRQSWQNGSFMIFERPPEQ